MIAPVLHTERLTLRAPTFADFGHWAAFFVSPRPAHEDGPLGRTEGYRTWAADVGRWPLRGCGPFGLDDRTAGACLGKVGICQPEGYPEPELGWFTPPDAEARGYAAEAARAVMAWARTRLGWPRLINIIDPANTRSIALGLCLGRVIDRTLAGIDAGDVVIRHDPRSDA